MALAEFQIRLPSFLEPGSKSHEADIKFSFKSKFICPFYRGLISCACVRPENLCCFSSTPVVLLLHFFLPCSQLSFCVIRHHMLVQYLWLSFTFQWLSCILSHDPYHERPSSQDFSWILIFPRCCRRLSLAGCSLYEVVFSQLFSHGSLTLTIRG